MKSDLKSLRSALASFEKTLSHPPTEAQIAQLNAFLKTLYEIHFLTQKVKAEVHKDLELSVTEKMELKGSLFILLSKQEQTRLRINKDIAGGWKSYLGLTSSSSEGKNQSQNAKGILGLTGAAQSQTQYLPQYQPQPSQPQYQPQLQAQSQAQRNTTQTQTPGPSSLSSSRGN